MPIYNVEKYIERALLSALNQTYQNLEILIVDDLGHDNSMNIVYQLKHTHPRGNCIRIITHKKNLGLGGTRNTAIESAQGKYLYFMDSDDAIVPDCIETLYNIISQEKVDFVAAGINQIDENENSLKITNYPNITRKGKLYNGTSNKWTKHFDFIIADVICINVAFFLATLIYSGSGHMYNTSLYRNATISLTLIHFCVAFFRNGYSGILRRGYLKEMKDVVYHNAIIMAVLFVYLFLIHQANNVSRIVILIFFAIDTILMYISRIVFKKFYAVRKNYDNAKENMLLVDSVCCRV